MIKKQDGKKISSQKQKVVPKTESKIVSVNIAVGNKKDTSYIELRSKPNGIETPKIEITKTDSNIELRSKPKGKEVVPITDIKKENSHIDSPKGESKAKKTNTLIQVSKITAQKLKELRNSKRECYDEVILRYIQNEKK